MIGYSLWQIVLNRESELKRGKNSLPSPLKKQQYVKDQQGRGLASVQSKNDDETGAIGRDPWGQPFLYSIKNDKSILFVWSKGPNRLSESKKESLSFQGDDIGYIIDLKTKQ